MTIAFSTSRWPLLLACASLLSACGGTAPPATSARSEGGDAAAAAAAASPYKPTATFQEVMDSVVDFSSDYIWKAVSTTVDKKGVHEMQPRTDEEWHEFRRRAVLLVEAANLIAVPGRKVANGDKAVEDGQPLEVAKIQQRLDTGHVSTGGFRRLAARRVGQTGGSGRQEGCGGDHRSGWHAR